MSEPFYTYIIEMNFLFSDTLKMATGIKIYILWIFYKIESMPFYSLIILVELIVKSPWPLNWERGHLSTLLYTFSQTHKLKNPKRIDNQIFTNFMLISRHQTEVRLRKFLVFFNNINTYYFIPELNAIYDNFTNIFFRFLAINLFLKLNSIYLIIISILS